MTEINFELKQSSQFIEALTEILLNPFLTGSYAQNTNIINRTDFEGDLGLVTNFVDPGNIKWTLFHSASKTSKTCSDLFALNKRYLVQKIKKIFLKFLSSKTY